MEQSSECSHIDGGIHITWDHDISIRLQKDTCRFQVDVLVMADEIELIIVRKNKKGGKWMTVLLCMLSSIFGFCVASMFNAHSYDKGYEDGRKEASNDTRRRETDKESYR